MKLINILLWLAALNVTVGAAPVPAEPDSANKDTVSNPRLQTRNQPEKITNVDFFSRIGSYLFPNLDDAGTNDENNIKVANEDLAADKKYEQNLTHDDDDESYWPKSDSYDAEDVGWTPYHSENEPDV